MYSSCEMCSSYGTPTSCNAFAVVRPCLPSSLIVCHIKREGVRCDALTASINALPESAHFLPLIHRMPRERTFVAKAPYAITTASGLQENRSIGSSESGFPKSKFVATFPASIPPAENPITAIFSVIPSSSFLNEST